MEDIKKLQIEQRKHENAMVINGLAIIAFSIWSVIKSGLVLLMAPEAYGKNQSLELMADELAGSDALTTVITVSVFIVIVGIALVADLGMRFKVGLSARREGMGGKKMGKGTMFLTFIVMIMLVGSIISNVYDLKDKGFEHGMNTRVIAILIDMTALFASIQLYSSTMKVRKIKKMISEA